jgi:hypothetical protein
LLTGIECGKIPAGRGIAAACQLDFLQLLAAQQHQLKQSFPRMP